jgi:hypothetical protein
MPDTLSPSITLTRTPASGSPFTAGVGSVTVALSANAMAYQIVSVGTTEEALPLGDVGTPGVSYFRNRDATNYVEIGPVIGGTFAPVISLKAGEQACFRFASGVTPYARAHTAAVELESWINSD